MYTAVAICVARYLQSHFYAGPPALTVNIMKNTESSSIVVQWDEVDDFLPTTYTVTWSSERDHIVHLVNIEEQSSYTITGITLDTVYTITITTTNRCGNGPEYSTSVSLTTDATSTISSLSSIGANPMTIMSTTSSSSTNTATAIMIASSSTATIISSTAHIISLSTTTTTVVMIPGATTTNPIATAVSTITDTISSITGTSGLQTTTGGINRSTSATTIVMSSTSTANSPDTTTADETSKFSDIKHIQ